MLAMLLAHRPVLGQDIKLAGKSGMGTYLTDAKGMTLYHFKKDSNNKSSCTGSCISKWPVFSIDNPKLTGGLNSKDFSTFKRSDGKKQTSYKGQPLYYFSKDKKPGDTFGNGVEGNWSVVPIK